MEEYTKEMNHWIKYCYYLYERKGGEGIIRRRGTDLLS
jgi:hypothetical protein